MIACSSRQRFTHVNCRRSSPMPDGSVRFSDVVARACACRTPTVALGDALMSRAAGIRAAREGAAREDDEVKPLGYLRKSQTPLTSLLFLLPLLILYEVGTH